LHFFAFFPFPFPPSLFQVDERAKVIEVEQKLFGGHVHLVDPYRYYVFHGVLKKLNSRGLIHFGSMLNWGRTHKKLLFFLMSDCLFYCTRPGSSGEGKFSRFRGLLPLTGVQLETMAKAPSTRKPGFAFRVWGPEALGGKQLLLIAPTDQLRTEWMKRIKDASQTLERDLLARHAEPEHADVILAKITKGTADGVKVPAGAYRIASVFSEPPPPPPPLASSPPPEGEVRLHRFLLRLCSRVQLEKMMTHFGLYGGCFFFFFFLHCDAAGRAWANLQRCLTVSSIDKTTLLVRAARSDCPIQFKSVGIRTRFLSPLTSPRDLFKFFFPVSTQVFFSPNSKWCGCHAPLLPAFVLSFLRALTALSRAVALCFFFLRALVARAGACRLDVLFALFSLSSTSSQNTGRRRSSSPRRRQWLRHGQSRFRR
jgi:hypothetical protein